MRSDAMRSAVLSLVLLCCAGSARAQYDYGFDFSKAGTAGYQFLKIGSGSREIALGQAATSLSRDPDAVFWNPGALSLVTGSRLSVSHNQWLAGSATNSAVATMSFGDFVGALSFLQFKIAEFGETVVPQGGGSPYTGRTVSAGDQAIGIALSRRFTDKLTIGAQLKYVREWLDDVGYSNVLFDVGALYYTGFHNLRLAFAVQHFGPDLKPFDVRFRMPLTFRLGAGEDVMLGEDHQLTAGVELVHPTDNNEILAMGLEYEFLRTFALRAGYRVNADVGNFSAGAGIHAPVISDIDLHFDYAYGTYGKVFGATHRFTLGIGY
jgi:hypothetical protein